MAGKIWELAIFFRFGGEHHLEGFANGCPRTIARRGSLAYAADKGRHVNRLAIIDHGKKRKLNVAARCIIDELPGANEILEEVFLVDAENFRKVAVQSAIRIHAQ